MRIREGYVEIISRWLQTHTRKERGFWGHCVRLHNGTTGGLRQILKQIESREINSDERRSGIRGAITGF